MEQQLQFIEDFANTIANTFRQFAQLCRAHLKKTQNSNPQFRDLQSQLIEERKKRVELQQKIRETLSGVQSNEQSLQTHTQERKRPKNAFSMYVSDQRSIINQQHPHWDLPKITHLAAIKWRKMSEQQRMIYQRKFEESCKMHDQKVKKSQRESNQNAPVKRQFREDDEGNRKHSENEQQNQLQNPDKQTDFQQNGMQNQEDNAGTLVINNDIIQQQTLNMEEEQKHQGHINQILDLFHTPVNESQPTEKQLQEKVDESNEEKKVVQSDNRPEQVVNIFREEVNIDPSIQIIQPIVIEPTVRESSQ